MPLTKCKEVFLFSELSDQAKEKARAWYRDGALDYDWWDAVYEDFTTIAEGLGFEIGERGGEKKIWFSGFCSQGDGACFEGVWRAEDLNLEKIREHLGPEETQPDKALYRIVNELANFARAHPTFYARLTHRGHYYHKHSIHFDCEEIIENAEGDTEDVVTEDTQADFECIAQGLMQWLYETLEEEHDYLLSDEAVDESIEANAYDFNEDGSRA
jgi:hypothetical protein